LNSIVGVVLTDTENYAGWLRKLKSTITFNDLWDGVCEGEATKKKDDKFG